MRASLVGRPGHRDGRDRSSPRRRGADRAERGGCRRIDDAVLRICGSRRRWGCSTIRTRMPRPSDPRADRGEACEIAAGGGRALHVLLKNDGTLLPAPLPPQRILLTGPYATSTDHLGAWVQYFGAPGRLPRRCAAARGCPTRRGPRRPGRRLPRSRSDDDPTRRPRPRSSCDLVIVVRRRARARSPARRARAATSACRAPGAISSTRSPTPACRSSCCSRPAGRSSSRTGSTGPVGARDLAPGHPRARGDRARRLPATVNPGGRVPMTFPRAVGQMPIHHDAREHRAARYGPAAPGGRDRRDIGLQGPEQRPGELHVEVPRPRSRPAVRLRARL